MGGGGGWLGGGPNLLKSKIPFKAGKGATRNQLPTFDAESKSAKIPNPNYGEDGVPRTNFQLLMHSPNLLKSPIPFMVVWGWGEGGP